MRVGGINHVSRSYIRIDVDDDIDNNNNNNNNNNNSNIFNSIIIY